MPANYSLFETYKMDFQKLIKVIPSEYHPMAMKIKAKKDWFDSNIVQEVSSRINIDDLMDMSSTVPPYLKKVFLKADMVEMQRTLRSFLSEYDTVSASSANNKKLADFIAMTLMLYMTLIFHIYWAYFNGVRNLLINGWDLNRINQAGELFELIGVDTVVWSNIRLLSEINEIKYLDVLQSGKVIDQADYMYVMNLFKRILSAEMK